MPRWTQDRDIPRLKYQPSLDPKGKGWHYLWESAGFGIQAFKGGRRLWIQCGSRKGSATRKWKSYFCPLDNVEEVKLADARAEGARIKADARLPVEPAADQQQRLKADDKTEVAAKEVSVEIESSKDMAGVPVTG